MAMTKLLDPAELCNEPVDRGRCLHTLGIILTTRLGTKQLLNSTYLMFPISEVRISMQRECENKITLEGYA